MPVGMVSPPSSFGSCCRENKPRHTRKQIVNDSAWCVRRVVFAEGSPCSLLLCRFTSIVGPSGDKPPYRRGVLVTLLVCDLRFMVG